MIIEIVILVIMSMLIAGLAVAALVFRHKHYNMIKLVAQLLIDKETLLDKIDSLILENSKEANEGFVKFLSDSRESAFTYIENVQLSINNYLSAIDSKNEDKITAARMELFSYLPDATEQSK
jgi:hypothetical protein